MNKYILAWRNTPYVNTENNSRSSIAISAMEECRVCKTLHGLPPTAYKRIGSHGMSQEWFSLDDDSELFITLGTNTARKAAQHFQSHHKGYVCTAPDVNHVDPKGSGNSRPHHGAGVCLIKSPQQLSVQPGVMSPFSTDRRQCDQFCNGNCDITLPTPGFVRRNRSFLPSPRW